VSWQFFVVNVIALFTSTASVNTKTHVTNSNLEECWPIPSKNFTAFLLMYTVSQKQDAMFGYNLHKCGLIFKILSSAESQGIVMCAHWVTSILPILCYTTLWKLKIQKGHQTVTLTAIVIMFKCMVITWANVDRF